MKVLCRHEALASNFIYSGLGSALEERGHSFRFYCPDREAAFDIFNELDPDLFIGQGYNLDRATIKCINLRPQMKVLLKVGCWGKVNDDVDTSVYPILMANEKEKKLVGEITNPERVTVFNYCHQNRQEYVIGGWATDYRIYGLLPAADTNVYKPADKLPQFECDVAFIGGYWGYKARNLDRYIIPLCNPIGKYNVKIFGNQHWPVPQYLGLIDNDLTKHVYSTATICPNVSEPHSNQFGFDVLPRIFNVIACKGFCIADYVESLETDIFPNEEIPLFNGEREYFELLDHFLAHPEDRQPIIERAYEKVMKEQTYSNRVDELVQLGVVQ